jgi:hypothetical protein
MPTVVWRWQVRGKWLFTFSFSVRHSALTPSSFDWRSFIAEELASEPLFGPASKSCKDGIRHLLLSLFFRATPNLISHQQAGTLPEQKIISNYLGCTARLPASLSVPVRWKETTIKLGKITIRQPPVEIKQSCNHSNRAWQDCHRLPRAWSMHHIHIMTTFDKEKRETATQSTS